MQEKDSKNDLLLGLWANNIHVLTTPYVIVICKHIEEDCAFAGPELHSVKLTLKETLPFSHLSKKKKKKGNSFNFSAKISCGYMCKSRNHRRESRVANITYVLL